MIELPPLEYVWTHKPRTTLLVSRESVEARERILQARIAKLEGDAVKKPVDFEVFNDPSYYDMWAVRPRGVRDFNNTLHFSSEKDARFAAHVIGNWMGNKPSKEAQ